MKLLSPLAKEIKIMVKNHDREEKLKVKKCRKDINIENLMDICMNICMYICI